MRRKSKDLSGPTREELVPTGKKVDGAVFTQLGSAYDLYAGAPIVWR